MENLIQQLEELLPSYKLNKTEADSYKKIVDKQSAEIKDIMVSNGLTSYEHNGIKASCTVSERLSFNEEKLLDKVRNLGVTDVIKSKEYVDMDALEVAIYNGLINPVDLAECQERKEVVTLRVK